MLDFNNLSVRRIIMHNIIAKTNSSDTATADYETNLFTVNDAVLSTIKERLINAAGRDSKAFELELGATNSGTFYDYCNDLKSLNDEGFISRSQEIADLLAESQKRSTIPGGYLIIIDSYEVETQKAIYIVIKAELHQALQYNKVNGQSQIDLLDQVFLSPSQKLYKIGILFEKTLNETDDPNVRFGCFLFDDQFRTDGHPAEYFYKDFLGFSVGKNSKIQSKRFFDKTENFIKSNIADIFLKRDLLNVLKSTFTINTTSLLTPAIFGRENFSDTAVLDDYFSEVVNELPSSFVKDRTLLLNQLAKKKINFPDNINITGPDDNFDNKVTILLNDSDLREIDTSNAQYTIVKILGKPFSDD